MVMDQLSHHDVLTWLRNVLASGIAVVTPPHLYLHLAGCRSCQGALLTTALLNPGRLPEPVAPAALGCQAMFDELAAFMEEDRLVGTRIALRQYPHMWWHLIQCPTCAAIYAATMPNYHPLPNVQSFTIAAQALQKTFNFFMARRRGQPTPQLLTEYDSAEYRLIATLLRLPGDGKAPDAPWEIAIASEPCFEGAIRAVWGDYELTAPLDADGRATLANLSHVTIADLVRFPLYIQIEAESPLD